MDADQVPHRVVAVAVVSAAGSVTAFSRPSSS
jgi:hypothetical protein